jgi:hypothetical protein
MSSALKWVFLCVPAIALVTAAGCAAPSPVSVSAHSVKSHRSARHVPPAGYGALVDAWNSSHTVDLESGGTAGESDSFTGQMSNYNPDPSLPLYGGYDPTDAYTNVAALNGKVLDYTINLRLGTTLKQVLAIVTSQLPKDAAVSGSTTKTAAFKRDTLARPWHMLFAVLIRKARSSCRRKTNRPQQPTLSPTQRPSPTYRLAPVLLRPRE